MEHVVVGVDTREAAPAALVRAADLAVRLGAELDVVHVQPFSEGEIRAMVSTVPGRRLSAQFLRTDRDADIKMVRALVERTLADTAVSWRLHLPAGDPVARLLAVADSVDASTIVIGSRCGGGVALERLLTGSISHRLIRWARRPVLVVPTDLDERHPDGVDSGRPDHPAGPPDRGRRRWVGGRVRRRGRVRGSREHRAVGR